MVYHFAAAHIRGHGFEQAFLTVEHADACGAIDLMAAESEEVAVEVLHVDRHVGHALRAVDEDRDVMGMGCCDDVVYGVYSAEHIADVGDCHDAGVWREQTIVRFQIEFTLCCDGYYFDGDFLFVL